MIRRLLNKFEKLLFYEKSPKKVALACGLAMYIAFSPFLGLHTLMLLASGWLLNLNIPLLIAVSYIVNNPWSMIPIFAAGYAVGYLILHTWLGFPLLDANPWWMAHVNEYLQYYLNLPNVSFWAFMLGANLLGIILGIITYFVAHSLALKVHALRRDS